MSLDSQPLSGNETCACGAYIQVMVYSPSELRHLLAEFRAAHAACRESVQATVRAEAS